MGIIEEIDLDDIDDLADIPTVDTLPAPRDPGNISYPRTLPLEVALETAPVEQIKASYNLSDEDWIALWDTSRFRKEVREAKEALAEEGMSFKLKAGLQAEELLKTSWQMIHNASLPATVRADLLKFTVRAAGLDGSKDQAANATAGVAMQINIQL